MPPERVVGRVLPIDPAQVDGAHRRREEGLERLPKRLRHPQRVREVVAGPEREDPQGRLAPMEALNHLLHRPVAPDGEDHVGVGGRLLSEERGVTRALGDVEVEPHVLDAERGLDRRTLPASTPVLRGGVEDDGVAHGRRGPRAGEGWH